MKEKIKRMAKKVPGLLPLLERINEYLVWPIRSGYARFMLWYWLRVRGKEVKALETLGFKRPKPILSRQWRRGKGKDGAHRRYYTAVYGAKRCFIKVAKNDSTIENEIRIGNYIQDKELPFVSQPVCAEMDFAEGTMLLAMEFTGGLRSFTVSEEQTAFAAHCAAFLEMLDVFERLKLVHGDIHANNLMLDGQNRLVVLDFGISWAEGVPNRVDYISRPGTYYYMEGQERVYDDAYSFVQMVKKQNPAPALMETAQFQEIESRIGRNTLKVKLCIC